MDEKQLQALYDAMNSKLSLGDYKSFKSSLLTDSNFRKGFYDEASHELDLGDYNTFDTNLKKKDGITPSPNGLPISVPSTSKLGLQAAQVAPEANNFGMHSIRELAKQHTAKSDATLFGSTDVGNSISSVDVAVNGKERIKEKAKKIQEAVTNTAKKYLTQKGIANPTPAQLNEQIQISNAALERGDVSWVRGKDGKLGLKNNLGFVDSIVKSRNEALKSSEDAAKFVNEWTPEQKVEYLKFQKELGGVDYSEKETPFIGENKNVVGEFLGENSPFIEKAVGGAALGALLVAGAPGTLGASMAGLPTALAFLYTAPDAINGGAMAEQIRRFEILKREHPELDEVELMKQAEQGKWLGGMEGLATNTILTGTALKLPKALEGKSVFGKYLTGIAKSGLHMGGTIGGLKTATELAGNLEGIETSLSDAVKHGVDAAIHGATTGALLHTIMSVRELPKILKSGIKHDLVTKSKPEEIAEILKMNEDAGTIPPGSTESVLNDLGNFKMTLEKLPSGLSEETQASVAGLIQHRDSILKDAETKDKSVQHIYKEKADAVDRQIAEILRTEKPLEHEIDEATGEPYKQPTFDNIAKKRVADLADKISKGKKIEDAEDLQLQANFPNELETQLNRIAKEDTGKNKGKENPNTEILDNVNKYLKKSEDTKLSQPIEGLDEQGIPIGENVPSAQENKTSTETVSEPIGSEKNVDLKNGDKVQWDVYGNEEMGKWTVGKKVKTRGGKDAVELIRDEKDEGGIHQMIHIVPLSELSKPTSQQTGNSVEVKFTAKEPPIEPPKEESGTGETKGEGIGITHADTKDIRIEFELGEYEKKPETLPQWNEQADKRIESGELPSLIKRLEEGGGLVDGTEQTMLGKYIAALNKKASENPTNGNLAELKKALLLNEVAGSKQFGQVGRARQQVFVPEESVAKWMLEKAESVGVEELTPEQKTDVTKKFNDYEAALKIETEKRAQAEEEISKLKAELALKTELGKRKTVRAKNTEALAKERKDIIDTIKDKIAKAKEKAKGDDAPKKMGIGGRTLVDDLLLVAPEVAKLVRNIVDTGTIKLEDIIDTVYTNLKDDIKGITKKDVNDLIAGEYNAKQKTKSELQLRLKDVKDEAVLINKLAALEAGEVPSDPRKAVERNQRIKELRGKIKDFEQRKRDAENEVKENERKAEKAKRDAELAEEKFIKDFEKEKESEAKKAAKAQVDEAKRNARELEKEANKKTDEEKIVTALKNRNEREFKQIVKDLANKNFEPKKAAPIDYKAALKKVDPQLWKETMDAIAKKDEAKHLWELEKQRDEWKKRGWGRKALDAGVLGISTMKTLKAGVDDSVTFIQLGMAIMANPRAGIKAKIEAIKDINNKRFKRQLVALHESPRWELIKESGLDITEPRSMHQNLAEEMYSGNLLDRNFVTKDGKRINFWTYTGGIFERLFTSMGNNMRVNLFLSRAEHLENQGMTYETHPKEFKDAARVINEITGRGKLNKYVEAASPVITPVMWAPKLFSSSLNLLGISDVGLGVFNKGFYQNLTPKQRSYALQQMGRGIGVGVSVITALAIGGWGWDLDPQSSTFGTVTSPDGTLTYPVFGRYVGVVKTIVQVMTGTKKTKFGTQDLDNPKYGGKDGGSVLGSFFRGKMTPAAGLVYDFKLNARKNFFTHEELTAEGLPDALLTPISVSEMKKGLEQDGSWSLLTRFLPAFEGINVSSDRDFQNKPKSGGVIRPIKPQKPQKPLRVQSN